MTHSERLTLIHRPFFITHMAPSYLWGGAAAGNRFDDPYEWADRSRARGAQGASGKGLTSTPGGMSFTEVQHYNMITRTWGPRGSR